MQRVYDHPRAHRQQEDRPGDRVLDDARGLERVHCVRGRVQRGPAGPQQTASEHDVPGAPLEKRARAQQSNAYAQRQRNPARGPHPRDRITQEQRDADHQHGRTDLV